MPMKRAMKALRFLAAAGCTASVLAADIPGGRTLDKSPLNHAIIYTTRISTDQPVRVRPFPADKADVGKSGTKEVNHELVEQLREHVPWALLKRFVHKLQAGGFGDAAVLEDGGGIPENALIVQGEFTALVPGNAAKSTFLIFVGNPKVCAEGTIIDADNNVLLEFEDCGIGRFEASGGESERHMTDDSSPIGRHLAKFMIKWANGEYE